MPEYTGDPKGQDPETFGHSTNGECLCGGIKVIFTKPELFTKRNGHLCHCANCRKSSGCVAANNMVVNKKDVQIDDAKSLVKMCYDSNNGSGLAARRAFCSNCGSNVYSIPSDSDEQFVLPLGIFPIIPVPAFELFAAHRHPWLPKVDGAKQYKFMTSSGELDD